MPQAGPNATKPFLRVSQLAKRGWSETMVKRLLGEPDKLVKNPVYRTASPMRMYDAKRVAKVESTDEFETLKGAAAKRSAAGKKVAQRKRDESVEWAKTVPINLPDVTLSKALERGFAHWRKRKLRVAFSHDRFSGDYHDDEMPPDTPDGIDPATRRRWAANWLRHCCTNYEGLLHQTFGRTGKDEAYMIIRSRVTEAINRLLGSLADTETELKSATAPYRSSDPDQLAIDFEKNGQAG